MAKPKPLTAENFPYTGPYGLAGSGHTSKGPTAEALKRFCWRMGFLDHTGEFDQHYNQPLEHALDGFDPGGQNGYGPKRCAKVRKAIIPNGLPHAGELGLDDLAIKMVQDEAKSGGTSAEVIARKLIAKWWRDAAAVEERWVYDDTFRPVPLDRVSVQPQPPAGKKRRADCSSSVVIARRYAMLESGITLIDPSKQGWTGFGNTDWYLDNWPKIGSPFQIGDLGHFHSSRHVIECVTAGTFETAEWGSNGTSAGPVILRLGSYPRFPSEFMFVVRPDLVA